ncbi:MAG TPA: hypothetical protein VMF29_06980 [Candidatus Edwardsbacteria bacterium]|nr:hypothetical protein [Candidatus Edwardsbacteria bacterium]
MSNGKRFLKTWVPQGAVQLARNALDHLRPAPWELLPGGWRTDRRLRGWNVESIVATQRRKWPSFTAALQGPGPLGINHEAPEDAGREDPWAHNLIMSYGYVLALAASGKPRVSLLDWGGGIGHYYLIGQALLPGTRLEYFCQEVPLLSQAGRELLPDATFCDQPDACFGRRYDLVMAGSSLWYERHWEDAAANLARAAQGYLYITRMLFVESAASFAVVQRPWAAGYRTEYQCWVLNRREFIAAVEALGMRLVREFVFGPGPHIHKAPEQAVFRGFLFQPAGNAPASTTTEGR